MYKPFHLIGLELNVSILSAALLGRPTGAARGFEGDVAAVAKRDLPAGERLDGEGGYTVHGRLLPARDSIARGALPIGLAHDVVLKNPIKAGECIAWPDVRLDAAADAVRARARDGGPLRGAPRECRRLVGTERTARPSFRSAGNHGRWRQA